MPDPDATPPHGYKLPGSHAEIRPSFRVPEPDPIDEAAIERIELQDMTIDQTIHAARRAIDANPRRNLFSCPEWRMIRPDIDDAIRTLEGRTDEASLRKLALLRRLHKGFKA